MALWDDERAQPVQIGFILVFAVLVISFAVYQSVFVPQQNAQVEFDHYQQVGQDVTDLRNEVIDATGSNDKRSVSVKLGTTYPARVFALNPSQPGGTLATTDPDAVEIDGLSASAADLCAENQNTVESRSLVYRPAYNEYGAATNVTYENSFVVRSFRGGARFGSQDFAEAAGGSGTNRINLRLVTNEFSESGTGTASVDLEPSRTNVTTFSPSTNFDVIVPSRFAPGTWRNDILEVDNSTIVDGVSGASGGRIRVEFNASAGDYAIACTAVGLNEQPAVQPPAPSGGGSGTTSGSQAYNTSWDVSAIESEADVQGCTDGVCTFDRSDDGNLTLTAFTDPTAVNATLDFASNTTASGVLLSNETETDTNGEGTTTLNATSTGGVRVYVASGGSGDVINISITGQVGPVLPAEIVYVDGRGPDSGDLQSVDSGGAETTYATADTVASMGAKEQDIDGNDALLEVPFVNGNQDLKLIDENDNQELLVGGANPPVPQQTRLGVGDVDGDSALEVVFVDGNSNLRQIDINDGSSSIVRDGGGNAVTAANVAGVADFDGDGDEDIVFVGNGNSEIRYLDDGTETTTGVIVSNSSAVGQPADLDDDGDLDVPHVNGNQNIDYTDEASNTATITLGTNAGTTSLATIQDRTGNGVPEVAYVADTNGDIRIVDDVDGTEQDAAGGERAQTGPGLAA